MKNQGHDVEVIKYDETSNHWLWKIRPFVEFIQYKVGLSFSKRKKKYLEQRFKQECLFKQFENKYFNLTERCFRNSGSLRKQSNKYDKIVIGSDQIWNPYFFDPCYLGSFIPVNERDKIVPYAPSFGTSNLDLISSKQIELIKSLKHLSCREEEGSNILKKFTGKDIPVVLDPTLMISEEIWNDIADKYVMSVLPEKYLLTYFLGSNIPQDEIDRLKNKYGLPVVNISIFNRINDVDCDLEVSDVGPGEFLYLIKNADHVVTDSFHGTIFSHVFKRKYTVVERFNENDLRNENSRIYTLLKIFGEQDRLYNKHFEKTDNCLQNKRQFSLEYLKNAINS